jgi:hypothetical protein
VTIPLTFLTLKPWRVSVVTIGKSAALTPASLNLEASISILLQNNCNRDGKNVRN